MITGTVHRYGDNIDTDVIIPARYLNALSPEELAKHCMEDIDPSFVSTVRPGDIMVGGWNFGCGSSREHAPIAIEASEHRLSDSGVPGSCCFDPGRGYRKRGLLYRYHP